MALVFSGLPQLHAVEYKLKGTPPVFVHNRRQRSNSCNNPSNVGFNIPVLDLILFVQYAVTG